MSRTRERGGTAGRAKQPNASDLVAQSGRALQTGDLRQAQRFAEAAILLEPTSSTGWHLQAIAQHHRGQSGGARLSIDRCLRARPVYPEAWNTLGNLASANGDPDSAGVAYRASIALAPDFADPYNNLGGLATDGPAVSLAMFRRAFALAPNNVSALFNAALQMPPEDPSAVTLYRNALLLEPAFAPAWNNLGRAHDQSAECMAAVSCFSRANRLDPLQHGFLQNLANAARSANQRATSVAAAQLALALDPADPASLVHLAAWAGEDDGPHVAWARRLLAIQPTLLEGWLHLASAYTRRRQSAEAMAAAAIGVALDPSGADAWRAMTRAACLSTDTQERELRALRTRAKIAPENILVQLEFAETYRRIGRSDLMVDAARAAIGLDPLDARAWDGLATGHRTHWALDEALVAARAALTLAPDEFAYVEHHGIVLHHLGRDGVDLWYDRAARIKGGDAPSVRWNRSLLQLSQGELGAWEQYVGGIEAGFRMNRSFPEPRWRGEDLTGKSILVWREQGVGDELVFASCYPDVVRDAGHCIIECDPRLLRLFRRSFPGADVRPDTYESANQPSGFDFDTPAGALPGHFRRSLADFPARQGFLVPDPDRVRFWRQRFAALGGKLIVGICWRGRLKWLARLPMYARLNDWGPILTLPDIAFVNLQYGEPEEEIRDAEARFGCRIHSFPDIDLMNDFDDVAAFGAALDLAITADTAGGALMGAVGVPTWRYVTRGDYLSLGTDRFPWMPSMRVFFRNPSQPWSAVTENIGAALRAGADSLARDIDVSAEPTDTTPDGGYEPHIGYLLESATKHQQAGRLDAAAALYRKVLEYTPSEPISLQLLGTVAMRQGRYDDAERSIARALRLRPDYIPAYVQLAAARRRFVGPAPAAAALRHALAWDPIHPEGLANLGECVGSLGQKEAASRWLKRASLLRPDMPEMEMAQGNLFAASRDFTPAGRHYRRALELRPAFVEAFLNLGATGSELGDLQAAERSYRRALVLDGQNAIALANIGALLRLHGDMEGAEAMFRRCLELRADDAHTRFVLALIALEKGNLAVGWSEFRAARARGERKPDRSWPIPAWDGSSLADKHVLVWREQGTGDELTFATAYGDLIAVAGQVTIETDRRLVTLLARSFPRATVRADTSLIARAPVDGIDVQVAAGDAASFLRNRLEAFPKEAQLLIPDERLVENWRQRMGRLGPQRKIGICWRSILRTDLRDFNYVSPALLRELADVPDALFINLQHGIDAAERQALEAVGIALHEFPDLDLKDNFEEVAALLSQLDAVVAPETTMACVAAGVGRPTFMFLQSSWMTLGTDGFPWFPAIRTFHKNGAEWTGALGRLARELIRTLEGTTAQVDTTDLLRGAVERHRSGDLAAAAAAYQRILERDPANPDARQLLGVVALQRGDRTTARRLIEMALAIDPAFPQALTNLGRAMPTDGEAIRQYERALRLDGSVLEANINLGSALVRTGRPLDAAALFRRVLSLMPAHAAMWSSLGDALASLGDQRAADTALARSLCLDPGYAQLYVNLGKARLAAGEVERARNHARTALIIAPDLWHAHNLAAMCSTLLGESEAAERAYRRAIGLAGEEPSLRWNQGLLHLQCGRLAPGWDGYESGLATGARALHGDAARPRWPGPEATGRLLVQREQGLGDELLFATCYPDLVRRGINVLCECDPRLTSLLRRSFPAINFVAGSQPPARHDGCDWQIPAGSLPGLFRRSHQDFPQAGVLLHADDAALQRWRMRLAERGARPKIGICWRSSVSSSVRNLYYASLDDLAPVLTLPGVDFVCLQHDATAEEHRLVKDRFGIEFAVWPDLDLRDDLDDVAALLKSLDLVIAPETAVGVLAGAVDADRWTFTNEGSWTLLGSGSDPWFPKSRTFTKAAGESWDRPMREMAAALRQRFGIEAGGSFWPAALAALEAGRHSEAEALLKRLLTARPDHVEGLAELANLMRTGRQLGPALALLDRALCLEPANARAITYLGLIFKELDNFDAALLCHRRSLRVDPQMEDAWTNLANIFDLLGEPGAALECHRAALGLKPNSVVAWVNASSTASALGDDATAADGYRRIEALEPGNPTGRWNLGLLKLRSGNLDAGWPGFELRFAANRSMPVRHPELPRWAGQDLRQAGILVWSEQGIGDEIVFATCFPEMIAQAGQVILECDARLLPLWRRSFPQAEVRPLGSDQAPPGIQWQAPSGDVARWRRRCLADFPASAATLIADPALEQTWRRRAIDAAGHGFKVGICWRGLRPTAARRAAYPRLPDWLPVLQAPGVHFFNLQYGAAEDELAELEQAAGVSLNRWPDLDLKDDFDGVAALMQSLDLIIGPDTAATALAGALGRPTWKLSPPNDWMTLGTGRYPWLPSVRLFPGRAGSWSEVLAQLALALRHRA